MEAAITNVLQYKTEIKELFPYDDSYFMIQEGVATICSPFYAGRPLSGLQMLQFKTIYNVKHACTFLTDGKHSWSLVPEDILYTPVDQQVIAAIDSKSKMYIYDSSRAIMLCGFPVPKNGEIRSMTGSLKVHNQVAFVDAEGLVVCTIGEESIIVDLRISGHFDSVHTFNDTYLVESDSELFVLNGDSLVSFYTGKNIKEVKVSGDKIAVLSVSSNKGIIHIPGEGSFGYNTWHNCLWAFCYPYLIVLYQDQLLTIHRMGEEPCRFSLNIPNVEKSRRLFFNISEKCTTLDIIIQCPYYLYTIEVPINSFDRAIEEEKEKRLQDSYAIKN